MTALKICAALAASLADSEPEVFETLLPPTEAAKARAHEIACAIIARRDAVRTRVRGVGRDIAVAITRELANRVESGEYSGYDVRWLDTHGLCVSTHEDKAIVSGIQLVVREANGCHLITAEIIEDAHNPLSEV